MYKHCLAYNNKAGLICHNLQDAAVPTRQHSRRWETHSVAAKLELLPNSHTRERASVRKHADQHRYASQVGVFSSRCRAQLLLNHRINVVVAYVLPRPICSTSIYSFCSPMNIHESYRSSSPFHLDVLRSNSNMSTVFTYCI